MANGVNIDDVVTALGAYSRNASKEIRSATLGDVPTTKYFRTVNDVDDEYFLNHSITDRVVVGFDSVWVEKGETKIKPNLVKARHFKVNYPIIPSTVWKTYLSYLANEKLDITQYPITKYIMNEVAKAVNRDRDYLLCRGIWNSVDYATVFGAAVDGLGAILQAGIGDGTMYKIHLPAFTSSNMVSNVEAFARRIPVEVRGMMDYIFMSNADLDAYKADYRSTFGLHTDYNKDGLVKEYFSGLEIVGLPNLPSGRIFTTYADNRVRVVNKTDMPILTDVQKLDYKVKLFMEWFEGLGFHINQHVFVSVVNTAGYASGITNDATTYFIQGNG
jgi:hypothetical protein